MNQLPNRAAEKRAWKAPRLHTFNVENTLTFGNGDNPAEGDQYNPAGCVS